MEDQLNCCSLRVMPGNQKQNMPQIRLGAGSGARGALKALKTGVHDSISEEDGGDGLPNKRTYISTTSVNLILHEPPETTK